jgi:hypothetical protein
VKNVYNVNIYWPFGKEYDTQFADSVQVKKKKIPYNCFVSKQLFEIPKTDINAYILNCHLVTNIRHKLQINQDRF